MSITSKFHSKSLASCLGNSYLASLLFNLWKKICSWLQAPSVHWCLASSWANGYQRTASLTHPSGLRGNRCPSLNCWDHSVFWMTSGLNMWAKVGGGWEENKYGMSDRERKGFEKRIPINGSITTITCHFSKYFYDFVIFFCLKMMALPIKIFMYSFF